MARIAAGLSLLLFVAAPASAQQPDIGYVYPAGAQRGDEVVVTVGGQRLDGVSRVYVSGSGVSATVVKHRVPIRGKKLQRVRMKLQELRQERHKELQALRKQLKQLKTKQERREWLRKMRAKRKSGPGMGMGMGRGMGKSKFARFPQLLEFAKELGFDEVDLERFVVRQRQRNDPLGQFNAQLSETVTLHVEVSADAAPGERELRLLTRRGLSNPIRFHVSKLAEVNEREPNDEQPHPTPIALPAVVNGQILPGDVDRFRFSARKGQRIVAAVAARRLIPYLADAVPGWFQATLTLRDANGKQVAYADDYRFHPDPVLAHVIPSDGEYVLEIKDAIRRGREDFVYRITLGEVPFVTSAFPLGGRAGTRTQVALTGWNLPRAAVTVHAPGSGVVPLPTGANRLPFVVDTLPELREREPNGRGQTVTLPAWINGRIGRPGDWDLYRFEGRAGQVVVAEVRARRLGSPLDSLLKLTDAQGRLLAANDDHRDVRGLVDRAGGLQTHAADSWLTCKLPRDGTYTLHVGDTQQSGSPAHAYRVRIGPPRPDFELRVVPATINARAGQTVAVTVHALRRDGYAGPVALALEGAPEGFVLRGARVPAGKDAVRFTLTFPRFAQREPVRLRLVGSATIAGRAVRRRAVPADEVMQAFLWRHLVPTREWMVSFPRGRGGPPPRLLLEPGPRIALTRGKTKTLRYQLPMRGLQRRLHLALSNPPAGVRIAKFTADRSGVWIELQVDAKAKVGLEGNLILGAFVRWTPRGRRKNKQNKLKARLIPVGVLPAIPFVVVAPRTEEDA